MSLNTEAFTPEEVEAGLLQDLLNYLLDHNKKNDEYYYDIHITTDGFCSIVEWDRIQYDADIKEKFVFADEEHELVKVVRFPDNHYEYLPDDEEQEVLDNWLKEHPGWTRNQYGHWIREDE